MAWSKVERGASSKPRMGFNISLGSLLTSIIRVPMCSKSSPDAGVATFGSSDNISINVRLLWVCAISNAVLLICSF